jgi:adenylosuccinate synthase
MSTINGPASTSSSTTSSSSSISQHGDISGYSSQVLGILGSQWGDEGKGKLVDILAKQYDIIARFNGGANAGHTLVVKKQKFAFHLLPCGILYEEKINLIGNGVVLDIPILLDEIQKIHSVGISTQNRLFISDRAHLLFDIHKLIDGQQETALADKLIGTTKKGIGPCYAGMWVCYVVIRIYDKSITTIKYIPFHLCIICI